MFFSHARLSFIQDNFALLPAVFIRDRRAVNTFAWKLKSDALFAFADYSIGLQFNNIAC